MSYKNVILYLVLRVYSVVYCTTGVQDCQECSKITYYLKHKADYLAQSQLKTLKNQLEIFSRSEYNLRYSVAKTNKYFKLTGSLKCVVLVVCNSVQYSVQ